jgi:hypothetical protein
MLMLKKLLQISLMLAMPFFGFSQDKNVSTEPDSRLKEAFTQEEIAFWVVNNPFLIQRYNFYIDHVWTIIDVPADKLVGADYKEVQIADPTNFNFLVVEKDNKLVRQFDRSVTYRIKGHDKLLVLLSEKEFTNRLNKALGRTK